MLRQRGFTMLELVVVMIVTAILAAVAIPKLFTQSDFAGRAGYDQVGSALRYAQKAAIAMRRNVCVVVEDYAITAKYAAAAGSGADCLSGTNLVNPATGLAYSDAGNALPAGARVLGQQLVIFDASGRPNSAIGVPMTAPKSITVTPYATPITVETETGLVR